MIDRVPPHVPETGSYVFVGFCLFNMAVCALIAVKPGMALRFLAMGRPLPDRWIQVAYRVAAGGIFAKMLQLLIQVTR
jgi:hypothetical protein